jgi:hypothetical protein
MSTHDSQFVEKTMHQVVMLEKKRSTRFLFVVRAILIAFGLLVFGLCALVVYQLNIQGSFDVLSLLSEDWEIISEYWSDVMFVFMSEFPTEYIPAIVAALFIGVGTYVITIRSRRRSSRALKDIQTLEKKKIASYRK